MTDSSDIAARAREWMEVGPDDPGYVEPEREVVELMAGLLAAMVTAETERDAVKKLMKYPPVCTCDGAMEIVYVDDLRRALGGVS